MSAIISDKQREHVTRGHHERQIWTRFGTLFLGLWLLASPATFGYRDLTLSWSDWISGMALLLFGLLSLSYRCRAWIWGGCVVGIWLQFAPLAFWASEPVIYVNDTLIGALAIAFCVLVPLRPKELDLGPQIPPGWTYNPSSWHQRIPVIFFGLVAWFLARYLASYQLHYIDAIWDPFFGRGTERVISSMISQEFPVADAGLGALAYSLEVIMGAKGSTRRWHTMPWIVFFFGILVIPVGFISIVLVMLQPIVVGAWCGICLIIALCMLLMLALTVDEMVAACQFLRSASREGRPFWKVFWFGSTYAEKGIDLRTPTFHASPLRIFKAMLWGLRPPLHLVATALLGIWLLFYPPLFGVTGLLEKSGDVLGALVVTLSVIAFAEVARAVRLLNVLLALLFGLAPWLLNAPPSIRWHSGIVAFLLILLSLPRGKIKERYGNWDKCIF